MTHQCPGPRCTNVDVPDDMLSCPGHWYQVPPPFRSAVWKAWDGGAGAGSAEHAEAVTKAVARMRPFKRDLEGGK